MCWLKAKTATHPEKFESRSSHWWLFGYSRKKPKQTKPNKFGNELNYWILLLEAAPLTQLLKVMDQHWVSAKPAAMSEKPIWHCEVWIKMFDKFNYRFRGNDYYNFVIVFAGTFFAIYLILPDEWQKPFSLLLVVFVSAAVAKFSTANRKIN